MTKPTSPLHLLDNIRPDIRAMAVYHVPDASGLIKLDAMENPYSLPPELQQKLADKLAQAALNRYPVPSYDALKQNLKAYANVPDGFDIMLGNGSDELIHLLSMALSKLPRENHHERATMLAPAPSFVMYKASAVLNHMNFVEVPLLKNDTDFQLDPMAMVMAIEEHRPALVYLPYPNNPTGVEFDRADMVAVIEAAHQRQAFVVVDEAYQPFAEYSWMADLAAFENLLVMRTVSKLGLAGVRLGYMVGRSDVISELDKVRPPYNVNVLTETAVNFMLEHVDILAQQATHIRATRDELMSGLRDLAGVKAFDSNANFVLVAFERDATEVFEALKTRGILVKNMTKAHELLHNCLRLTVGTDAENRSLLVALQDILK